MDSALIYPLPKGLQLENQNFVQIFDGTRTIQAYDLDLLNADLAGRSDDFSLFSHMLGETAHLPMIMPSYLLLILFVLLPLRKLPEP